jgi:hypothetical protein
MNFDIGPEVRAINKAMANMLAKARAHGIAKPSIFFESEGHVYVMDDEHDGQVRSDRVSAASRQEAIVASGRLTQKHDVGAW